MESVESQITEWRDYVAAPPASTAATSRARRSSSPPDHDLDAAGLTPDEAFLIAVKRMGDLDSLSREFALEHSGRLWKQLILRRRRAGPRLDRLVRDARLRDGCRSRRRGARLAAGSPGEDRTG